MKESFTLVLTTIVPTKRRFDCAWKSYNSCFNFQLQRIIYLPCCFHCFWFFCFVFLGGGGGAGGWGVCVFNIKVLQKKLHVCKLFSRVFLGEKYTNLLNHHVYDSIFERVTTLFASLICSAATLKARGEVKNLIHGKKENIKKEKVFEILLNVTKRDAIVFIVKN